MRRALRGSACFVRRMRSSCPVPKFFPCKAELSMRPKRGDNRGKPVKFVPFTSALCWMLGKRIVCLRPPALRQNNGAALGAAPLKRADSRQAARKRREAYPPGMPPLMPMQLPRLPLHGDVSLRHPPSMRGAFAANAFYSMRSPLMNMAVARVK